MKGPFPIFCRGHSGSRLLCEAYRKNAVWMGKAENKQRDAYEFAQVHPEVRLLVERGFYYATLSDEQRKEAHDVLIE
ncbi:MAG TPA: hypothetical protein VHM24_06525, partial [Gemmatimonadaceae bacterium]|nr:hypothetical protein [Gemmatimonadaceae bacterium]